MTDCKHDLAIGQGSVCYKCGKELVFFKALASVANANMGKPLLKLTEVIKDAGISMQKLSKQLRKLQTSEAKS